jgi:hypothetical protein
MSRTDNSDRFEFQLGAVVEDVQTGLTGVVVALSEHITGCERYGVMPDSGRGSQRPDEQFYYAQELEQLKTPAEGPFAEEAEAVTTECDLELGQIAFDNISSVQGYVTTITYQLLNCPRAGIRPSTGTRTEAEDRVFRDVPRLAVVDDGVSDEYDGLRADAQDTEMAPAATGAPGSDLETKTDLA